DGVLAGVDVPFAPRSDDLDIWGNRFVSEFEADLIIALASAAVGEAVGAEFECDFGLTLGNDGTRHGSAEEIGVFVNGPSAESRPNEIADKFFAEVFDTRG